MKIALSTKLAPMIDPKREGIDKGTWAKVCEIARSEGRTTDQVCVDAIVERSLSLADRRSA